jgi:hypothetical protein
MGKVPGVTVTVAAAPAMTLLPDGPVAEPPWAAKVAPAGTVVLLLKDQVPSPWTVALPGAALPLIVT